MITVTTPADDQLLATVQGAKDLLGITDASQDALLESILIGASSAVSSYCGRVFGSEVVTETTAGSDRYSLVLTRRPLISVSEVRRDDDVVDTDDYQIESDVAGILYNLSRWAKLTNYRPDYWAIDYTAGYVLPNHTGTQTLPGEIEQACLETIKTWFLGRCRDMTIRSEQVGEYVDRTFSGQALPLIAQNLLKPWRDHVL
jgi:hypothetical protein